CGDGAKGRVLAVESPVWRDECSPRTGVTARLSGPCSDPGIARVTGGNREAERAAIWGVGVTAKIWRERVARVAARRARCAAVRQPRHQRWPARRGVAWHFEHGVLVSPGATALTNFSSASSPPIIPLGCVTTLSLNSPPQIFSSSLPLHAQGLLSRRAEGDSYDRALLVRSSGAERPDRPGGPPAAGELLRSAGRPLALP